MTSIHDYSDIIGLPRPEPQRHTRMSRQARAAQFAPFAALTGFSSVIEEISRTTVEKPQLDDSVKQQINRRLLYLKNHPEHPDPVRIVYFLPDEKKSGGSIETIIARVDSVDDYKQQLVLSAGIRIPFHDILDLILRP